MSHPPLLEARGVNMDFPGVRALAGVDLSLHRGEVHAIVGENGAGKSTLVRILAGELAGFGGEVVVRGSPRLFDSPRDALAAGIAIIPQELQLVSSLTVAENIALGHEPGRPGGFVDRAAQRRAAEGRLDAVGAGHIPAGALVGSLDAADRQLVAIARALAHDAAVLIMDEPTASLGATESARLAGVVSLLASQGAGVVYVSHKLEEVTRLADRITVLRDGQRVATLERGATEGELVRLMVGREIPAVTLAPVAPGSPERLRVEGLSLRDPSRPGGYRLRDVSFAVRSGEVLGLAGLVGAGRTDLLLALVGALDREVTGRIALDGREYVAAGPAAARDAGLVLLPEERKGDGIFPHQSVTANLVVASLGAVSRLGVVSRPREREAAAALARRTGVRGVSLDVPISTLSGGNQQKALLARCLFASPRVLLLDEPTRGIDLASRAEIYAELQALAGEGYAIVLASSEMSEVLTQCHRILVFRDGRVTAEFSRDDVTEEKVMAAAAAAGGGSPGESPARESSPGPDRASRQPGGGGSGQPSPRAVLPLSGRSALAAGVARYAGLFGLALVVGMAIVSSPVRGGRPIFLDLGNLTDILRQVSEKGILAVGMTAVVVTGGIDLSVGSVLAFGATLSAWAFMRQGAGLAETTLLVVVAGAAWGALNGLAVARWRLPAFIATLATMSAARGAARWLSGGTAIPLGFGPDGAPDSVQAIADPLVMYVPAPALIFGLSVVVVHLYLSRTRAGRYLYAIGDNPAAARLAGIRVGRHVASVYIIAAVLAAVAGLVHAAQLQQGNPNDGVAYELDAIAAVVIGGTPLSGGTGSVLGTLVGMLTIGVINNSMGLNNVDANLQLILKGAIILVAVWLQRRRTA